MTLLNTGIGIPQQRVAVPHGRVEIFTASGNGDMGSMTLGQQLGSPPGALDTNNTARFPDRDAPFIPLFVRVHFAGGSGTLPDFALNIDSGSGPQFDMVLAIVKRRGTGSDVNWYLCPDDDRNWMLEPMDRLVATWTNPDSGNMLWGMKVGLLMLDQNEQPS